MKPKIIIGTNSSWVAFNFRAGLIQALLSAGYDVVVVASYDAYSDRLSSLGCRYVPLKLDAGGTHPFKDLSTLLQLFLILKHEKPKAFLGFTPKINIYGGLACQWLKISAVNNIAGLGFVFVKQGLLMKLVLALYRLALKKSFRIFFQNNDDKELFLSYRLARPSQIDVLPGSGVNLEVFKPAPMPVGHPTRFLLVARMLWDKGVGEFVDAAKALRNKGLQAEFCLLGFTDVANPAAIKSTQIEEWVKQGFVKYLGSTDDVKEEIQKSHCVVLPSYREGTPRALLEAAAMARPIVTTIAVGCKEVVDDGISGFLCPPKDSLGLAHKMELICNMGFEAKKEMGLLGRKKMERQYDEKIILSKYLKVLENL